MKKSDRNWLTVLVLGATGIGISAAVASRVGGESHTNSVEEGDGAIAADANREEGEFFPAFGEEDITRSAYSEFSLRKTHY